MPFTLDNLAAELGIDPATLQAKPEVTAKWNGYLSEADTKYTRATAAQKDAQEKLELAQRDQQAIDEQITNFGVSETRLAELQASNAALNAALEEVKKQGLNVNMPNLPTPKAPSAPDPVKTVEQLMRGNFANMGQAMQIQARYQSIFGKPFTDDPVKLIDEANAARLPVAQYAEQKYKFSEETAKQQQAELQRKIDEGVKAEVTKYKEEHPVTAGHPGLTHGLASKHPQIFKPRSTQETNDFRGMSVRDRVATSVSRVKAALASNEA